VVLAKLDAAIKEDFLRTVRPHKDIASIDKIITSIVKLRKEMPKNHKLVLQSLLYNSYRDDFPSNAHKENIESLAHAINKIDPDLVQIYSIARSPAEYFVYALGESRITQVTDKLKNLVNNNSIKIVGY
jgi:wyosine [tRNA(Phe)-imidazoG37] synthetase (radical SAM superfamily)